MRYRNLYILHWAWDHNESYLLNKLPIGILDSTLAGLNPSALSCWENSSESVGAASVSELGGDSDKNQFSVMVLSFLEW